jgi:hypothetical protein
MKQAGVVRMTEDGTRNLYELDLGSLEELRRYLDRFWESSLQRFKNAAEESYEKQNSPAEKRKRPPVA